MKANMHKTSEKEKFNPVDSDKHWPISIKIKFSGFLLLTLWNILQIKSNKYGAYIIIIRDVCHVQNTLEIWRRGIVRLVNKVYQL